MKSYDQICALSFQVLEDISNWRDPSASSKGTALLAAITKDSFVIGMLTLRNVLSVTKPLAASLQTVDKDLIQCMEEVRLCVSVMQTKRDAPDLLMEEIAADAEALLGEEIKKPRTSSKQTNRPNVEADTAREYYRRTVLIPFLDGIINDLNQRFSPHTEKAMRISALIPAFISKHTFEDVSILFDNTIVYVYDLIQYLLSTNCRK